MLYFLTVIENKMHKLHLQLLLKDYILKITEERMEHQDKGTNKQVNLPTNNYTWMCHFLILLLKTLPWKCTDTDSEVVYF